GGGRRDDGTAGRDCRGRRRPHGGDRPGGLGGGRGGQGGMSFAVLRLRGKGDLRRDVKDTLRMLHLTRQNHCSILPQEPTVRGMLQLVKDHVTWGEIDAEVLARLLLKRGRQVGDRPIDDAFVKAHSKFKSIWDLSQALAKGEARLSEVR